MLNNLKIRVNSEQESKEAQELFFELSYKWLNAGKKVQHLEKSCSSSFGYLVAWSTGCFTNVIQCGCGAEDAKEITMQELRDTAVLKRNEPDDANFENKVTGIRYFVSSAGDIYFWCGDWQKCHASFRIEQLNPIKEEVVKEYLFKYNDQYTLVELSKTDAESNPEQYIEVPEWANYAYNNDTGVCFLKNAIGYNHPLLIWQRESLNNKVASAEVARQKTASQWDLQVGGDHYKSMKIQPAKFALENKLDYCQANAIKYICRHASKNGKQDLEKAKHYIDLLIEHYYSDTSTLDQ